MTFPYEVTVPLLKDIESQDPQAICELRPRGVSSTLIVNREAPPFDNAELRRAMALSLDRRAFIDVLSGGQGDIGAAMLPPPEGLWGMPPERLRTLPGYDPDLQRNRSDARAIMEGLGWGPDHPLSIRVAARNIPLYRDPAIMLIDQLKEIYIAGDLDLVETANWNPKVTRRDYMVGLENTGNAVVDDPDQQLYESYACDSDRNFTGYCNRQLEELFHQQTRGGSGEAQADGLGYRRKTAGGGSAAGHLSYPRRNLLAPASQGIDDDGQQHGQWLAHGRRLARQVKAFGASKHWHATEPEDTAPHGKRMPSPRLGRKMAGSR